MDGWATAAAMTSIDLSTHQIHEAVTKALEKEKGLALNDVIATWQAVGTLVKQQLFQGKGVRITGFGSFATLGKEPVFVMGTDFGRQCSLKQKAMVGSPDNIPIAALNYAQLAETVGKTRDVVDKVVAKLLYILGRETRAGRTVLLTLHRMCEVRDRSTAPAAVAPSPLLRRDS